MGISLECAPCGVVMSSWSARGSPVRYWQCPSCSRILSSVYDEALRRCAVVRRGEGHGTKATDEDDVPRSRLQARAESWFARLEREERGLPPVARRPAVASGGAPLEG